MLVPFPFSDLSAAKVRPAVVLSPDPSGIDMVVAFVSSVVSDPLPAACLLVAPEHSAFPGTGLRQASVVRADKLVTISRASVLRRLGSLDTELMADLDARLRSSLGL